jgi:pimeloyl-ACP methyl ester carboxylesterase
VTDDQELQWVHPNLLRPEYELRAGFPCDKQEETNRRTDMIQAFSQSGVVRVNNTQLYYDVAGAGHPLTLAHGLLLDRSSWDDQFGVFARQYTVVRYDLRGWGDSAQEPTDPPYSPRQDLLGLLDSLNIQQTYLLGLSGAGTVALDFTLEHPERVDALILVASGLSGSPQRMTENIQAFIAQYYGALQRKVIAGAVEATVRFWTDGPKRRPEQVDAQARERITHMGTRHIQRHGDLMAHQRHMLPLEPPAIKRLAEVNVPTLIVVGDLDTPETLEIADVLEQGIAGAQKTVISGTAHHPHMEKPEEFNRIVMNFLSELLRRTGRQRERKNG